MEQLVIFKEEDVGGLEMVTTDEDQVLRDEYNQCLICMLQ